MEMDLTLKFSVVIIFFGLTEICPVVTGLKTTIVQDGLCGRHITLGPGQTKLKYYPWFIKVETCIIWALKNKHDAEGKICFEKGTPFCVGSMDYCNQALRFSFYNGDVETSYGYHALDDQPICHRGSWASVKFTKKTNSTKMVSIVIYTRYNNVITTTTLRTTFTNVHYREDDDDYSSDFSFVIVIVPLVLGIAATFTCCLCCVYWVSHPSGCCSGNTASQGSSQTNHNHTQQSQEGPLPGASVVTQEVINSVSGLRRQQQSDVARFELYTRRYLYQDGSPGHGLQQLGINTFKRNGNGSPPPYTSAPPPPPYTSAPPPPYPGV